MQITLTRIDQPLADAWQRHGADLPKVTVYHGWILDLDTVGSPANSYGFSNTSMLLVKDRDRYQGIVNGGIDTVYSRYFGWLVQERLQELIKTRHHGETLVGAAEIVETDHLKIPYLIAAPTLRVPLILHNPINPLLAAHAALRRVRHGHFLNGVLQGEPIATDVRPITFNGAGTGVGTGVQQIGRNPCAHQVRAAVEAVALGRSTFPMSWFESQRRHQKLYNDRVRDLQKRAQRATFAIDQTLETGPTIGTTTEIDGSIIETLTPSKALVSAEFSTEY